MANKVPGMLNNYNCYLEGGRLIGVVDTELPKFDPFTEEISGAGLLGSYEEVILGHFKSMTVKLNFRVPTKQIGLLWQPLDHLIELRSAIQNANGIKREKDGYHVTLVATPKAHELGKMEVGKPTGNSIEMEVFYILIIFDGVELVMLDKKNFIYRVNEIDQLKEIRDLI